MTTLARSAKPDSGLVHELGRDWRRWSAAERCAAVAILTLASIALPLALIIVAAPL